MIFSYKFGKSGMTALFSGYSTILWEYVLTLIL